MWKKGALLIHGGSEGLFLSYEDYDVECFGGADYECSYSLDKDNTEKFERVLRASHKGTLEEMILEKFGKYMEKESLYAFFEEHGIEFDLFTWIS